MHGLVLGELRRYVEESHGAGAWPLVVQRAGTALTAYYGTQSYPDAEFLALATAAAEHASATTGVLLHDFGAALAPRLLAHFRLLARPEWGTLELLERGARAIALAPAAQGSGGETLSLRVVHTDPHTLLVTYAGRPELCRFLLGLARGLARDRDDGAVVLEPHAASSAGCQFLVKRVGRAAHAELDRR